MCQKSSAHQSSRGRRKPASDSRPLSALPTTPTAGLGVGKRKREMQCGLRLGWAASSHHHASPKAESWSVTMMFGIAPVPSYPGNHSAASPAKSQREGCASCTKSTGQEGSTTHQNSPWMLISLVRVTRITWEVLQLSLLLVIPMAKNCASIVILSWTFQSHHVRLFLYYYGHCL